MCTYANQRAEIDGSAKGPNGSWFDVTDATVYFDHPSMPWPNTPSSLTSLTLPRTFRTGRG
jgi:hypothetical protein